MNRQGFLLPLLSVFVLTCVKTLDGKHGNKLVLVTGLGDDYSYPNSEVIGLGSDTGSDCNDWTEFPIEVVGATGALFNIESGNGTEGTFLVINVCSLSCLFITIFILELQTLLICGGINFDTNPIFTSNECFVLDKYSSKLFARLSEKRAYAASLINDKNNFWVTGGYWYNYDYTLIPFSSTEYISKNGESVKGPELPLGLAGHAVISVNSTVSMFIGGLTEGETSIDLTFYYDHYNQVWSDGPRLNFVRSFHGAGIVTDLITREKLAIITGGVSYDDDSFAHELRSTEILIDGKWVLGNCDILKVESTILESIFPSFRTKSTKSYFLSFHAWIWGLPSLNWESF